MVGDYGGNKVAVAADVGQLPGASGVEAAVPWALLGLAPGAPFDFHVASAVGTTLPEDYRDNLGSSDGTVETTAWTTLEFVAPRSVAVPAGATVDLHHQVTNLGNVPTAVTFAAVSSLGAPITWLRDDDGDGAADTLLAHDDQGDGLFSLPGDSVQPGADSDGDGMPDLAALAPGETAHLVARREIAPDADGQVEDLQLRVWMPGKAAQHVLLHDRIAVGDLVLRADEIRPAAPGEAAWFPHQIDNTTASDQVVSFATFSSRRWPMELMDDPGGQGDPLDATALSDSDGDGNPDLMLPAGSARSLLARVDVPAGTSIGTGDLAFVQARIGASSAGVVRDQAVAEEPLRLRPHHRLSDGQARHGGPGSTLWFGHRLDCARERFTTLQLDAVSDLGWPVELWADPDGNGRPDDAVPLTVPQARLENNGGVGSFLVRVSVPDGAAVGEVSRITVTAVADDDPGVVASAEDDAVVALIRVFDDPAELFDVSRIAPCRTARAVATGLPALSDQARIIWRRPDDTPVRILDANSDGNGEARDILSLRPEDPLGSWTAEFELFDGVTWVPQDSTSFQVAESAVAEAPALELAPLTLFGDVVRASARVTNTDASTTGTITAYWRVVDSARSVLLANDGSFSAFDGSAFTSTESVLLDPLEERSLDFVVAGINHPSVGSYEVELSLGTSCGTRSVVGSVVYEVSDDDDRDGLRRADELAAGTDPDDPDSDDDGLLDGQDGVVDSDGDGAIDALDCDADDDGLLDGLESGLLVAGPGTDLSAGCFVLDRHPESVTDPDVADSDGGGIGDGDEDRDGNGRVDLGETDPELDADDLDACDPEPPREVNVLRASRQGPTGARVTWVPLSVDEPCLSYTVSTSDDLPLFEEEIAGLEGSSWVDDLPVGSGRLRSYLVSAVSLRSGPGPSGLP